MGTFLLLTIKTESDNLDITKGGNGMAVDKKVLHGMIEQLSESDRQLAYGFLLHLLQRAKGHHQWWDELEEVSEEEALLTEQEKRQLQGDEGYVTGGDAKREFGLQIDLP
ncbi:XRE family transcriptional regulator [Anoxybacillus flavithermus NBRC 109594]|uniref:XRE family transcriptional regulator n=2 Tax=Anoxybacillus flavithermus TaxID=33934 RepID=R4FCW7_9BACL|nr:XRE family transcriptional regulator [Anoxybacillus flavithermus NBRC 109594]